ncbi:hypothetical protein ACFL4T_03915 [candidate division KSB1 bacterium]
MNKVISAILSVVFILSFACDTKQDSLDEIKDFKPENKYFKSSLVTLHFKIETSPIPEIDSLFTRMINYYGLPVTAEGCKDGVYTGESPYDAYDYKHVVIIKIKNGKITSVDYNEVHKNGKGKQEDEEYCKEMSVTGTTPAVAYPDMEKQLLEKQNIQEIKAVTGASYSLYRFRYAVTVAFMKAGLDKN